MYSINRCALIVALFTLLVYFHQCQCSTVQQADSPSSFIAKVCAAKLMVGETINAMNHLFMCDCSTDSSSTSTTAFKQIICAKRKLNNNDFNDYTLPDSMKMLSMGWNNFDVMPELSGNGLTTLDMSHNNITKIDNERTFENVKHLIELDLSWNRISAISSDAFHKLSKLKRLDLSHNQLNNLPSNLFVGPSVLEVLILSNNVRLNEQFGQQAFNLFGTLGVPTSLARLEVNEINLDQLNLEKAAGLTELFVRYNRFNESTNFTVTWPHGLEIIDLSGNPFQTIPSKFLTKFSGMREIFLRRMPILKSVEENAFANLTNLIVLDFEGSKNLVEFNANAFGEAYDDDANDANMSHSKYLERLNLRGAKIERLSATLMNSLEHLKRFDLYGNPLNCDCKLRWLAKMKLDTSGRCEQPAELNGTLISNIAPKEFTCLQWPNVVYALVHGILVMSLFAIFTIPIWLIVLYVRPRRHQAGRKIGATSPYARITIESNRAEDMYF